MELNIGGAIRRLRRERDVTQDELASAIGVTAQAVSKWERAEGYPDITLLPEIARYFGVTLDTVYGMDAEREKEEIRKIIHNANAAGDCRKAVEELRRGLERFPQSFALKAELAYNLMGYTSENYREHLDESIRIHEEILERCTDQGIRSSAIANICTAYERAGYHEKALETAKKLPNLYKTAEIELCGILSGDERVDTVQGGVQRWVWCLYYWVWKMRADDHYSADEKIALYQKVIGMYEIIYENHDHLFGLRRTLCAYQDMAELWLELGETGECMASLSKAADYAVLHDALDLTGRPTSLLINRISYDAWTPDQQNARELLAKDMQEESRYDGLRETDAFRAILAKL
ncbi:MAG: helix-turn-helix transcriptional regulator [Clostridia bacterium]|nr:helix-turn-helix transcriptional regulator [Clostridia bacterium]